MSLMAFTPGGATASLNVWVFPLVGWIWYSIPILVLGTLIALWRTIDDANAFFARQEHQDAMRALFRERWQYSHFACLWEMAAQRQRVIFCQICDAVTPVTARVCSGCGDELFDPYAVTCAD